jgi:hypothetical protein
MNVVDELGNKAISLLRAQGHLPVISTFIDFPTKDTSKMKDIKFYCKRLMAEEFGDETKTHFFEKSEDFLKFLLDLQNISRSRLQWRDQRGYFLTDKVEFLTDPSSPQQVNEILLSGYLKNLWGPENIGHITGYGDFVTGKVVGDLQRKNGAHARFVKDAHQIDDFVVYASKPEEAQINGANNMTVEEDSHAPDEFADLRNELQKLTITAQQGKLRRSCRKPKCQYEV